MVQIDPEGILLPFYPKTDSINISHYSFDQDGIIKKDSSDNSQGKFLPCADPLPSSGRFYYKIKLKTINNPFSIRFGFISSLLPSN